MGFPLWFWVSIRRFRWPLLLVSLLSLVAYGLVIFNLILVGDDWMQLFAERGQYDSKVSFGRWLQPLLWMALADNRFAPAFTFGFMLACWFAALLALLREFGVRDRTRAFFFLALFCFSPFWAETAVFKNNHAMAGLATLLAVASGIVAWRSLKLCEEAKAARGAVLSAAVAALLFALAAAGNQAMAPLAPMVALLIWIRGLLQDGEDEARVGLTLRRVTILAAIFIVGSMLYLASVKLSQWALGLPPAEGHYGLESSLASSLPELGSTLSRTLAHLGQFFFFPQHLVPLPAKLLFLVLLAICGWSVFAKAKGAREGRAAILLTGSLLLAAFLFLPWALGALRLPDSYRYNGIVSLALVYAGIGLLALEVVRSKLAVTLTGGAALLLALIFVFQQNAASLVTYNLNRRDLAVANRMLERIETLESYAQAREKGQVLTIHVLGVWPRSEARPFAMPKYPGPMDHSIVECGIFDCQTWRLAAAFRLLGARGPDYQFVRSKRRDGGDLPRHILTAAAGMKPWPHPASIRLLEDGTLLILLSPVTPE